MVWKQSEAGTLVDHFDGAEKVFYDMSKAFEKQGKEHGSVYVICKFSLFPGRGSRKSPETLLRNAWTTLRYEFPTLSVIAEGSKKIYRAATPQAVEKWADSTFFVEVDRSAREILATLHLRKLPCLFFLPRSSEIVFHSSHWRIDALGACMVLDRFFEILSGNKTSNSSPWNLEYQNLSPSLEDAFGCHNASTPGAEVTAQTIRRRNFETSYPSAGLPSNSDLFIPPASHETRSLRLTAEATTDLIAACKEQRISVTAAIHAACSCAIFDLSKGNKYDYSTVVSVNLRDYLPSPYNTKAHACATYVTGITHKVRRADEFAARSAKLTKDYKNNWDALEYMTALRSIYRVHGEALQTVAKCSGRKPATNVTVSSLGLVEKYLKRDHGALIIDKFELGSAIMGKQPTLYIWTFRDEMSFSLDYNEAYYSAEMVVDLLDSVKKCLERELKLSLETEDCP